ncbi:hypothetical protein [Longibacter salinarum]|uniref:hypothetical protein n=1 Tax=Longibacter salinarum TaxID=1850348 RepID=UPI00117D6F68|nr:hypothetical protein [Longibacter salinarum]
MATGLSAQAGVERSRFGCSGGFCDGADVSYTATGIALGIRYGSTTSGGPFGRLGAVDHTLYAEANQGTYEEISDGGLGFEMGGGYAIAVPPNVYLTPGVAYTRCSVESADGVSSPVVVMVRRIGVRYAF